MSIISKAAAEKLLKKANAERVSGDAKEELVAFLEEIGLEIAKESVRISTIAKRKTVKAEDIKMVLE